MDAYTIRASRAYLIVEGILSHGVCRYYLYTMYLEQPMGSTAYRIVATYKVLLQHSMCIYE